jgi:hypothetical protein
MTTWTSKSAQMGGWGDFRFLFFDFRLTLSCNLDDRPHHHPIKKAASWLLREKPPTGGEQTFTVEDL